MPTLAIDDLEDIKEAGSELIKANVERYRKLLELEANHPNNGQFTNFEDAVRNLYASEADYRFDFQPFIEADFNYYVAWLRKEGINSMRTRFLLLLQKSKEMAREQLIAEIFDDPLQR